MTLHKELTEVARGLRQAVAFTRGPSSSTTTTTTTDGDATDGRLSSSPYKKMPPLSALEVAPREVAAASEEETETRGGTALALKASARLPQDTTTTATMHVQHALLCDGLSQCKGALAALLDLRQVSYHCWLVLETVCSSAPSSSNSTAIDQITNRMYRCPTQNEQKELASVCVLPSFSYIRIAICDIHPFCTLINLYCRSPRTWCACLGTQRKPFKKLLRTKARTMVAWQAYQRA